MKFSEKWLREWVDPPLSGNEFTDLLTMGGMEVDSVMPAAPEFSGVVVARIESAQPHPDADKLQVCKVNDGCGELIDIVCGAANARVGLVTALATVGASLPGGMKVKKAKLRGVQSFGMLSSASELGLEESADGILELPESAVIGQDLRDYLELDDTIIEVDLTPNRGDCFSVCGIARDIGVLSQADVSLSKIKAVEVTSSELFPVNVMTPDACPSYAGRVITGINSAAKTPLWLKERLRRSGLRTIHPVVDITNYVMLELGQPMHAFDLSRLESGIIVRYATESEKIDLLDGSRVELEPDTLIIADHTQAVALAGIMGGQFSAVSGTTIDIFLESAFFTPEVMAGKARRYRAQTDSSHRFERGVDYQLQIQAIERASTLILEICGGCAGKITSKLDQGHLPERTPIHLRKERINRMLGETIEDEFVEISLERLGMSLEIVDNGWNVTAPSHRFDITIEADLIEEIARVKGYNKLSVNQPMVAMVIRPDPENNVSLSDLRSALTARGYQEAITYSFVEPTIQSRLNAVDIAVTITNPISSDMSVMRTSLLPGLIQAMQYNRNRQNDRVRLFETGMIFTLMNGQIKQRTVIAGIICGNKFPEQWGVNDQQPDFFDLKNDVESLLALTGEQQAYHFVKEVHLALHPGQSAAVMKAGEKIGNVGVLSPFILRELDIDYEIGYFQLNLSAILQRRSPEFKPLSKFPIVRRDISLLVDQDTEASTVLKLIWKNAPETLKNLQLFDVYHGEGIDSVKKSVALGLIFQGTSSTLVDRDIDQSLDKILTVLKNDLDATLRV